MEKATEALAGDIFAPFAGGMHAHPGFDIGRDSGVERAVVAFKEVDEPGFVGHGTASEGKDLNTRPVKESEQQRFFPLKPDTACIDTLL